MLIKYNKEMKCCTTCALDQNETQKSQVQCKRMIYSTMNIYLAKKQSEFISWLHKVK